MVTATNHVQNSLTKVLLLVIFLISLSCKSTPTGPHITANLQLTKDYVTCTEVWVEIVYSGQSTVNSGQSTVNSRYLITRDGDTVLTGMLAGTDTVVIDTTAQPATGYAYRGYRISNGEVTDTSGVLPVTTLNTTSDNFTWQTFTFGGDYGSCVLRDVAIINDTLAYADGEIWLSDSVTGSPDPQPYCLARWNGNQWGLMKLKFFPPGSTGDSITSRGFSIFSRNETDIWLAGDAMFHCDGAQWKPTYNTQGAEAANKVWGDSSGSLWCVGNGGSVVWYNGSSWQKLQSGISLDVYDIYGSTDTQTGKEKILAACTRNYPIGHVLLSISPSGVTQLSTDPIQYELFSVWFVPDRHYYLVGDGIFEKNFLSEAKWKNGPLDITHYGTTRIRGNAINDIIAVGAFGDCLHFNGVNWKSYRSTAALTNGSYTSVAIKGNLVIAVGGDNPRAVALVGRR